MMIQEAYKRITCDCCGQVLARKTGLFSWDVDIDYITIQTDNWGPFGSCRGEKHYCHGCWAVVEEMARRMLREAKTDGR